MIEIDPGCLVKDFHPKNFTAFSINSDRVGTTPCFSTIKYVNPSFAKINQYLKKLEKLGENKTRNQLGHYLRVHYDSENVRNVLSNPGEYFNMPTSSMTILVQEPLPSLVREGFFLIDSKMRKYFRLKKEFLHDQEYQRSTSQFNLKNIEGKKQLTVFSIDSA